MCSFRPSGSGQRVPESSDCRWLKGAGSAAEFGAKTLRTRSTKQQLLEQAENTDTLVPIRLDLESDGHKLRDVFTWNLSETLITPEHFAEILCHDMKLPGAFISQVARSIREQIDDYKPFLEQRPDAVDPETGESLRITVKLDIGETNASRIYMDELEWELDNGDSTPEELAEVVANELSLTGEYRTAIAHSIREQVHVYRKTLSLLGYTPGSGVLQADDELRAEFLPPVLHARRPIPSNGPILTELTDAEMDKIERDAERDVRRKRRQTRNR
ncbi:hypothetical protein THASP1DRAFT_21127, partial [Thamnocephalis sphaerospora]